MQINHRIFDLEIQKHNLNDNQEESFIDFLIGGSSGFEGFNRRYRLLLTRVGGVNQPLKVLHGSSQPCFMCAGGYSCPSLTKRKDEVYSELQAQLAENNEPVGAGQE
ncbi:hypothetical protein [Tumebacillus flagellatus]|uniref:Uncharacterized protein n=1 Tax=Tumebacillus flagellatus TaxID=1157490 RepID=A0A074LR63_9BACL|nr:hypothetical protein [Tumebacillus flagellatus]KEO82318.1 hypothetical protein EL26_16180 [Tumebacillus flagellatus]